MTGAFDSLPQDVPLNLQIDYRVTQLADGSGILLSFQLREQIGERNQIGFQLSPADTDNVIGAWMAQATEDDLFRTNAIKNQLLANREKE